MSKQQNLSHYKSLFVDFHNPEFLEEAFQKFDAQKYINLIKSVKPDMVMFWANDHYGNCFYDTEIGHKHSRLKGDYFGELTEEAHKSKIAVFAYFVVGWHNYSAIQHPDWEQVGPDGKPWNPFPSFYWKWVCLNSPQREYCIAQMKEITGKYDIEGIWIDILATLPCGCYCQYCQEKFERMYGTPMPRNPKRGSIEAKRITDLRYKSTYDFIQEAKGALEKIKPELIITYNGSGDILHSAIDSDALSDKLSQERALWKSKWARTQGKPFEFLVTRGYYSWSDWTIKPLDRLRTEVSTILANGGRVLLGDHGNPDGTLEPYVYKELAVIFEEIGKAKEWVTDTRSVSDVAVLHSVESHKMKQWLSVDPMQFLTELSAIQGAYKILIEGKKQFEIISEKKLSDLSEYNSLIIPNQLYLSEEDVQYIEEFVRNGGNLISTYETGLRYEDGTLRENFVLNKIMGVDFLSPSLFSMDYIDDIEDCIKDNLPEIPLLISPEPIDAGGQTRGRMKASVLTRIDTAQLLARITHPSCERTAEHWVSHSHSNPRDKTQYPAIAYHKYGRGQSVYFAQPIFKAYWNSEYHPLRDLVLNILGFLGQRDTIEVTAPLGVEVVLTRRENNFIIHLVNLPQWELGKEMKQLQESLPIFNIEVKLKALEAKRVLLPLLENKSLSFQKGNGFISFSVPQLDVHQIVVVEC